MRDIFSKILILILVFGLFSFPNVGGSDYQPIGNTDMTIQLDVSDPEPGNGMYYYEDRIVDNSIEEVWFDEIDLTTSAGSALTLGGALGQEFMQIDSLNNIIVYLKPNQFGSTSISDFHDITLYYKITDLSNNLEVEGSEDLDHGYFELYLDTDADKIALHQFEFSVDSSWPSEVKVWVSADFREDLAGDFDPYYILDWYQIMTSDVSEVSGSNDGIASTVEYAVAYTRSVEMDIITQGDFSFITILQDNYIIEDIEMHSTFLDYDLVDLRMTIQDLRGV